MPPTTEQRATAAKKAETAKKTAAPSAAAKKPAVSVDDKLRVQAKRKQVQEDFKKVIDGQVSAAEFLGLTAKDARYLLGFAMTMAERDQLETAEAAAEVAVSADPVYFDAWMVLGSVRARRKEAGKALEAYAKAAALDSKNARLWCDVGEIKLSIFDYEGAAKALEMALNVDPNAKTPGGRRAQALIAKTYAKASGK
jgi:tetratricopeptide (TPR) repeat protein